MAIRWWTFDLICGLSDDALYSPDFITSNNMVKNEREMIWKVSARHLHEGTEEDNEKYQLG